MAIDTQNPNSKVIVISGCPGSGKSTLAAALAARSPAGVHLATDAFFRFPAHRLDPSSSAAANQNAAIQRAYLASALSFRNDGCEVVIDGVVPNNGRSAVEEVLGPCRWLTLHASLDCVLQRCAARNGQSSAHPELVRRMHAQFANESTTASELETTVLDTTALSPEQVLGIAIDRLDLSPTA